MRPGPARLAAPGPTVSLALLTALLLIGGTADAQTGPWSVDDVILAEQAPEWTISSDGRVMVWIESSVVEVEGDDGPFEDRVDGLRMRRFQRGADIVQLTRGQDHLEHPAISPDDRHVGFLSDRQPPDAGTSFDPDAQPQLWVQPLAGGEAFALTQLERPVLDFSWIDGETLLIAAQESPALAEALRSGGADTSVVVDDPEEPPVRLFRVTLDGEVRRLSSNRDWIDTVAVAPGGRWAVIRTQESLRYEFDEKVPPRLELMDLDDGSTKRLFADGVLRPERIRWAPDGSGFYFVSLYSTDPRYRQAAVARIYRYDLAGGQAERVDGDWERGLGSDDGELYAALPDGVLALQSHGLRYAPARYTRRGGRWSRQPLTGVHAEHLDQIVASADGSTVVYRTSSATEPPQWWAARLDGARLRDERPITDLNPGYEGKPTGRVEAVTWTGARDEAVEGLLHYPLDWREGERRPLVLDIHGGPASADRDTWDQRWAALDILFRQRGAFVLQVNYHGSAEYGLEWLESIAGHYYELEIPDIEKGVDTFIDRGLVDPERLAVTGWSNGGILGVELITRTRRYKAASIGAADVEWISDWANVDFGAAFDNYYLRATPWEGIETYLEKAPFFRLDQVTTPTLVHTGTEDRAVPPHQSWSLFRVLQWVGKAPVRLVLYPGEPHGLLEIAHQRRKATEDLAWFDRYLFGVPEKRDPAVLEGSLLDALLHRSGFAREGDAWGRLDHGVLVPETVNFEDLEVGRFEVTRAQWASFAGEPPEPGRENLPATGIAFEDARAYAAWLAGTTGRPFRLPTEDEARDLADAAGVDGNTLDYWAGYTPNPDDSERLGKALADLGTAPLLLPAGSLAGAGEALVFDLDGNAAEWAAGENGAGVAVGPSADRSTDEYQTSPASPAYTGLRVVVGEE